MAVSDYGLLAYGLAVSVVYIAAGAYALDRGGPALLTCCLPWGLIGLMIVLNVELFRILDSNESRAGHAVWLNYLAYGVAIPTIVAHLHCAGTTFRGAALCRAGDVARHTADLLSGSVMGLPGKAAVASLILLIAVALVIAGVAGGVRRLMLAGSGLFGIAILILLWQTIGTLLDQSLFFLVAGAVLLGLAGGARRLFAHFGKPAAEIG